VLDELQGLVVYGKGNQYGKQGKADTMMWYGRESPSLLTRADLCDSFRQRPPCVERTAVHAEEGVSWDRNSRDKILENEITLRGGVPVHGIIVDSECPGLGLIFVVPCAHGGIARGLGPLLGDAALRVV
jgi:hypothetical protein